MVHDSHAVLSDYSLIILVKRHCRQNCDNTGLFAYYSKLSTVNVDYVVWSLIVRTSPLRHSGVDHTVLPANTPHLPSLRSSPEGATTE